MFPDKLLHVVLDYLSTKSTKQLSQNFKKVSQSYRNLDCHNTGSTKNDVDAYLIGRMPLTFAVIKDVLWRCHQFFPRKMSVTDYGCGPGTAYFAIQEALSEEFEIDYTGIEEKTPMIQAAQDLSLSLNYNAKFKQHNVEDLVDEKSTLAIASYLLNELENLEKFYHKLLHNHDYILVIEPGTPDGYQRILSLRTMAINAGFHILAPCPHKSVCPLKSNDWCHFFTRCARPKILKQIKEGSLGYEDEKYSYLLLSKQGAAIHQGVILEKPQVLPFKIELRACCCDGSVKTIQIMKKEKDAFKSSKKLNWGDFI